MSDVLTPLEQQHLFGWLRWRQFRHLMRDVLGPSSIRSSSIVLATAIVVVFVFSVSYSGFNFLHHHIKLPLSGGIVGTLIDLLFFTLGVLLVFSCGLMLYGGLFNSAETSFLMSRPLSDDHVFSYKFQSALGFSSWAFLLLGGPILIAYGIVAGAPWYFYPLLFFYFSGYILLPGSVGALCCLLMINFVPRRRKELLFLVGGALLVFLGVWIYRNIVSEKPETWGAEGVNRLLDQFLFARSELAPNHWVARGLQQAGRGAWQSALYYLALIWSNGLFLYLLAAFSARYLYRRGLNRVATGGTIRRRHGGHWLDRIVERAVGFLAPSTRLLVVKDFRTFRRDPQQWGQILLFAGLMGLYLTNIRNVSFEYMDWRYICNLSLLNLWVIALLTSIYTGRFIYPLLSMEGRNFWVLGLMPMKREQLLWGKFVFSAGGATIMASSLVLLSDLMLKMPWYAVAFHLFTVPLIAAGLSGLSVGLGACLANFRETDPFKIAVGFGGTVNLIVSLAYLVVVLGLLSLPLHIGLMRAPGPESVELSWMLILPLAGFGATLGIAAVIVPLRMGLRALRRVEF